MARPDARDRALPDGHCELVVHLGTPCARIEPGGEERVQTVSLAAGQAVSPVELRPLGPMDVFGVRFRPDAAAFLPAGTLAPLREVWGRAAADWESQLREARTTQEIVRRTDQFLRAVLRRDWRPDAQVRAAVELLRAGRPVARVAAEVELSVRQLQRRFQTSVGLSPKLFARIARFQRALTARQASPQEPWAETALACGYFDQAHLAYDFRTFSGQCPTGIRPAPGSLEHALLGRDAFFQDGGPEPC